MTVLRWLCRVYPLLLRAYPGEFRERYADEMAHVFRDRGREIAQSSGTWGLLGYTLSTGRDWSVSVLRERMDSMKMPSLSMLRWVFLFCVALDLVFIARRATPATYDAPLPFAQDEYLNDFKHKPPEDKKHDPAAIAAAELETRVAIDEFERTGSTEHLAAGAKID